MGKIIVRVNSSAVRVWVGRGSSVGQSCFMTGRSVGQVWVNNGSMLGQLWVKGGSVLGRAFCGVKMIQTWVNSLSIVGHHGSIVGKLLIKTQS